MSLMQLDEVQLDRNHFVVACSREPDQVIEAYALIDCGASGFSFIDEGFVRYNIPLLKPPEPTAFKVIDG